MTELIYITLSWVAIVFIYSAYIIQRQQRTIDRLTDKLMAKDYSEYKRYEEPVKTKPEEDPEKLSYFDQ